MIIYDTRGAVFLSASYVNSSDKRRQGWFGVLVEIRPAGDSETQVIREQDESKSYQRGALIALLFTAHPETNELPASIIKHPAEVPPLGVNATTGRK